MAVGGIAHGQIALVGLDNPAADGQAEPQANVARRKEWLWRLRHKVGGEAWAVILHFDAHPGGAIADRIGVRAHGDFRIRWSGLERIQEHFREGILESRPVTGKDYRIDSVLVGEAGRPDRLILLSLLVGFFDQRFEGEGVFRGNSLPGEKSHLVGQARDPFDALG